MRLIILGRGGYGRTIYDLAMHSGKYSEILFLDDNASDNDVVGKCSDYKNYISPDTVFYPAFGNNSARISWINDIEASGADVFSHIDSTAYIGGNVKIGNGTVILPKAIINTGVCIKRGCIINCGAIIDHDCIIEDGAHICLGAIIKGENRIQPEMKIEAGVIVENGKYSL